MMSNATHGTASQTASQLAGDVQKKASRIFWQILAAGFLTPILVGIAVNFYLQLSGNPHLEWSELWSVGNLIALLTIVILSWFPFVLLAWVARSRALRRGMVEKPVYGAFFWGRGWGDCAFLVGMAGDSWSYLWGHILAPGMDTYHSWHVSRVRNRMAGECFEAYARCRYGALYECEEG